MSNESTLAAATLPLEAAGSAGGSMRTRRLALFALALGTFCIGTTEFASMGIIQLFSASLGVDIPTATHAITAYAIGVVVGAPALTLFAARLNRRTLLLSLIGIFILGNVLSAMADRLGMFIIARGTTFRHKFLCHTTIHGTDGRHSLGPGPFLVRVEVRRPCGPEDS